MFAAILSSPIVNKTDVLTDLVTVILEINERCLFVFRMRYPSSEQSNYYVSPYAVERVRVHG